MSSFLQTLFVAIVVMGSTSSFAKTFTLEDITRLTLEHSTKIKLALLDYELAKAEEMGASLDFDPLLTLAAYAKSDLNLSAYTYENRLVREHTKGGSVGFSKMFSLGTKLEGSYQSLVITTDSRTTQFTLRKQHAFQLKLTQPLAKGGGKKYNLNKTSKAKYKIKKYQERLKKSIDDELEEALKLAWDIYQDQLILSIKNNSYQLYQRIYQKNLQKRKLGKYSNSDLASSLAKSQREKAKMFLEKSNLYKDSLKLLKIISPANELIFNQIVNLKIDPAFSSLAQFNFKIPEIYQQHWENFHFENSSPVQEKHYQLQEDLEDFDKARNEMLPTFDLSVELLSMGLSNRAQRSYEQVKRYDYPGIEIALNFVVPLGIFTARGIYKKALFTQQKSMINKARAIRSLETKKIAAQLKFNKMSKQLEKNKEIFVLQKSRFEHNHALYSLGKLSLSDFLKASGDIFDEQERLQSGLVNWHKTAIELSKISGSLGGKLKNIYLETI